MQRANGTAVRRRASIDLSVLAVAGIAATLLLSGLAIWTAHERQQQTTAAAQSTLIDT